MDQRADNVKNPSLNLALIIGMPDMHMRLPSRKRPVLFSIMAISTIVLSLSFTTPSQAEDTVLTLHHFLSPKSATHTKFLAPWATRVQEQSDGAIEVKLFPSMALGGKPPELYRQVRDGAADIVWTLIGYTPGVFPRSEVFELPTVHQGSAEVTNLAIQELFDEIADDYPDIHPILIHVHAGNALHMVSQDVRSPKDLTGVKLRTPSRTGAWMIEAFGAEPVGMPVPELPQALSRGAVDGALVPFEVMPPLKLHQLTNHSVEGRDGQRFGTSVFLFAMNKERYEALPPEQKAIIDANSGIAIAGDVGRIWDGNEEAGKAAQMTSGGTVSTLNDRQMQAFIARSETVTARWIEEMAKRGIDGAGLVERAREAIARNQTIN
ncbi:MAG: TRAP transporter substrate-binding protein [Pseudomonadota bacterium]